MMPRLRPELRHRRDERGAIAAATAIVMGCMLVVASLVVDVGRDRIVSRDMQAMADVIALDVVRQLDGRPAGVGGGYGTILKDAADVSLEQQVDAIKRPDAMTVKAVVASRATGAWHEAAAGEVPNAVWVHTTGSSPIRFLPSTAPRTGIKRSALAMIGPPIACISAGATFLDVYDNQQGPLDTLLGKIVGVDRLTVLDPYGLAALDLEIPLVDLAAKLNVGSVNSILTANVSAKNFLIAIADVLPTKNGSSANPKSLLDAISSGLPDVPGFTPGDVLSLDTGGGTGTTLVINTFTLVQAVILRAGVTVTNGENFLDIMTNANATGLAKVDLAAKVVEAPKVACGPVGTTARSAQIQLRLKAEVKALNGLVASADIDPLYLSVADGSATITDIRCTVGSPSVAVNANTAVGTLKLRVLTSLLLKLTHLVIAAPDPASKPNGVGIGSTSTHNWTFTFPTEKLPPGHTFGTSFGSLGLSSITPIKIDVTGVPVGGLLTSIVQPLLALIDPLVSNLLRPVLENLGVSVGTVRIQPTSRPSCNEPFLIK